MSHSHGEEHYDHPITHHNATEGFDRSEPNARAIFLFTAGSVILLVLVIMAIEGWFQDVYQQAVYDKILSAPSIQLKDLRDRDAWNLSHYMYGDHNEKSGRVRIPVDKAMELFAQEASAGKLFYPAKAAPIKKEDTPAPAVAPAAAGSPATGSAAVAAAPAAKK